MRPESAPRRIGCPDFPRARARHPGCLATKIARAARRRGRSSAQRVDGDAGDDGGIDAAAQAEHGGFEAALVKIIAQAKDQRVVNIFFIARFGGTAAVGDSVSTTTKSSSNNLPLAISSPCALNDQAVAVKNKFVVAADLVAEHDRRCRICARCCAAFRNGLFLCRDSTARRRR